MNLHCAPENYYRTISVQLKSSNDQGMIPTTSPQKTKSETACCIGPKRNACCVGPKRKGFRFGKNCRANDNSSSEIETKKSRKKCLVRSLFRGGGSSSSKSSHHVEQSSPRNDCSDMKGTRIESSVHSASSARRPQHESEENNSSPADRNATQIELSYQSRDCVDATDTSNNIIENGVRELRRDRSSEGLCPFCGTRLFEISSSRNRRSGFFQNNSTGTQRRTALNIEGVVENGNCVKCLDSSIRSANTPEASHDNDNAAAIIASAMISNDLNKGSDHRISSKNMSTTIEPATIPPSIMVPAIPEAPIAPLVSQCRPIRQENASSVCSAIYKGSFNNFGERHGKGEMTWSNGDRFEGNFSHEQRSGKGTLDFADGGRYIGGWKKDKMHGMNCTRSFPNGDYYMGDYDNGERHGHGSFYFANGDVYVGFLECNKFQGFGRYYNSKTGTCFEGMFFQDQRQGKGKFQFADGRIDVSMYHANKPIGLGLRWSGNRKKAWKLLNGKVSQKVHLNQAAELAKAHNLF